MGADTILDDFTFPERDAFISLYPQGYCNVDKMVRAAAWPGLSKQRFAAFVSMCCLA